MTLFQILAVLSELGPIDASAALERMEGVVPVGEVPSLPAFYRHLNRAIEAGWVVIEGTDEVGDERGGRPARLFRVTPEGRAAVRQRAIEIESVTRWVLRSDRG